MNNQKNDSQSMAITIAKIKKQSKNLLKLSNKNNNSLNIDTLSQAQELLSQIHGYPSWHAIQKSEQRILPNLALTKTVHTDKHSNLNLELKSGVYYLEDNFYFKSYFKVKGLTENSNNLAKEVEKINNLLSFHLNIGIHNISLYGESIVNEKPSLLKYELINTNQEIVHTNPILKKILKTQSVINDSAKERITNLNLVIEISTSKDYWSNHQDIINLMYQQCKSENIDLDIVKVLSEEKVNNFKTFKNTDYYNKDVCDKLNNNLLWNSSTGSQELVNMTYKWVYLLNFIQKNNILVEFKVLLRDGQIHFNFLEDDGNNPLVRGFLNSIIKTKKFTNESLNFRYINDNINNFDNTLNYPSLLNHKLYGNTFKNNDCYLKPKNNMIIGRPGSGKSILTNNFLLSNSIKDNLEEIPKTLVIDIGKSSFQYIDILRNTYSSNKFEESILVVNLDKETFINIFDLPLGIRKYSYSHKSAIIQALLCLFSNSLDEVSLTEDYLMKILNQILNDDKFLYNIKYVNRKMNKTYWELVDDLFKNNNYEEAIRQQRNTVPNLSDLLIYLEDSNEEIYNKLAKVLKSRLSDLPVLGGITNIDIQDKKIVCLDFDKICKIGNNFFANYMCISAITLSNNYLFGIRENYPQIESKKTLSEFISIKSLNESYEYYHQLKFGIENKQKLVLIDEIHRFNFEVSLIKNLIKNANRSNISVSVTSQNISDLTFYSSFFTDVWIDATMNPTKNELDILKILKIDQKDFIFHNKVFSWIVKSNNNLSDYKDIVKIQISKYLEIALSSSYIDILVRKEMLKKYSYLEYLDKLYNYLRKKEVNNLHQLSNKMISDSSGEINKNSVSLKILNDLK